MTKPIDPESITLHALDRLSPTDAHEAEAAVAQDPELARQLREVEDIAAHLWHASSPLHSAPAEIWDGIAEQIKESPSQKRVVSLPLALVGWAAALVLLLVLAFQPAPAPPTPTTTAPSEGDSNDGQDVRIANPSSRPPRSIGPGPGPERSLASPQKLRAQLHRLKEQLARYENTSKGSRPTIVSLHPPGTKSRPNPQDSNTRVISLITEALAHDLRRRNEVEVDLVIEQGWDSDLLREATDDMVLRHRSFLEATADLELLTSEDGRFYDPATEFLWTPAEDGGGFLGQRASADLDLGAFVESIVSPDQDPGEGDPILANNDDDPQGYLVEDPLTHETTLLVDKIPPQPPGSELIARVENANGDIQEIPVTPTAGDSPTDGTLGLLTVPLPPGFTAGMGFEFTSRHPDGTNQVILSNDQAGGTE